MSKYGCVGLVGSPELTYLKGDFLNDIIFSDLTETIDLLKILTKEEFDFIRPYDENIGFKKRDPKKFEDIFLKINDYLKKDYKKLYDEYKDQIKDVIKICKVAIQKKKKIDFYWDD